MKAVKRSDFAKYGCVNCGCEYCYSDGFSGPSMVVICAECHEKFFIVNDSMKSSDLGFPQKKYDGFIIPEAYNKRETLLSDFLAIVDFSDEETMKRLQNGIAYEKDGYVYPLVTPHPRVGIPKHPLIIPDIRPEDGRGDYCYPRGVGYDLACFVKSKEAGLRITEMINRVNEDYHGNGFSCRLDYRENEPLWIQVKISYPNELRAQYLADLIHFNDDIISEESIRMAMNIPLEQLADGYLTKEKDKQKKK